MPYILPHDLTPRSDAGTSSVLSHMFPSHEHVWHHSTSSTPSASAPSATSSRPGRSTSLKSCLKPQAEPPLETPRRSKSVPKLVHYPSQEGDLQSVRVFKFRAKPKTISRPEEETETETEGYDSSTASPRPIFARGDELYALDMAQSSPVPKRDPSPHANVWLETLQMPALSPLTLHGSVIVRNVAFDKSVTARFSLDGWMTTHEVDASYVSSMATIPQPFHDSSSSSWDRFTFRINLADKVLRGRTLSLVLRYRAAGGEWWDNNGEQNYSLAFVALTSPPVRRGATRWLANVPENIPRSTSPLGIGASHPDTPVPRLYPVAPHLASPSTHKFHTWMDRAQHLAVGSSVTHTKQTNFGVGPSLFTRSLSVL